MFGLGTWELLLILLIILVIFGAGKLPEIGGSLGKALKNFKSSTKSTGDGDDEAPKDSSAHNTKDTTHTDENHNNDDK